MLDDIDRTILNTLSDGQFHSGEAIGETLNVSRAAVWKHIKHLESLGCEIISISRQGYKLKNPIELLEANKIKTSLTPQAQQLLNRVVILDSIDSTNDYARRLLLEPVNAEQSFAVLAEQQTHGRGRRGRSWTSPFGSNIYLSLHWPFDCTPTDLGGLGLVVGLAVRQALADTGIADIQVKWPNDILHQQRKLAGVLVEIFGEANAPTHVIIGAGINVAAPQGDVGQAATGLQAINAQPIKRNQLAALLINNLTQYLSHFQNSGLSVFQQEWLTHDAFYQSPIRILQPHNEITGTHAGIDNEGHLLLETEQGQQAFGVGDVSLRKL